MLRSVEVTVKKDVSKAILQLLRKRLLKVYKTITDRNL
jgi:hypothetical protein